FAIQEPSTDVAPWRPTILRPCISIGASPRGQAFNSLDFLSRQAEIEYVKIRPHVTSLVEHWREVDPHTNMTWLVISLILKSSLIVLCRFRHGHYPMGEHQGRA